ncbi:hypothetical protein M408DRAFT_20473 [Serendipita vermifera MAFF 305830]|uniref:PNPLA domain-containing protein n=1 Tax=Serendipita vermifera MAFF 305830 TaxID=933852 RepID=A0A0C3BJ91_SERVB|nr:hypothetical protein M408DRAFT_20473 [Serendipita vermifera MAFF 305830]
MDNRMDPSIQGLRVLSLDGGGMNCLSQLQILKEFMARVEYDTKSSLLPCQYFHLITGVGASGVIAILLGVLRLSVQDTSVAFLRLCNAVSLGEMLSPIERSTRLVTETRALLQEYNIPEGSRLRGDLAGGEDCRVCIPYLSVVNMTACRMLRSYAARHSSYNPTIIEAISIAWATPGLFSPVKMGPEAMEEELISAVDGYSNPTIQAVKEAHEFFGKDQRMSCLLSIGVGRSPNRSLFSDGHHIAQRAIRDTERTANHLKHLYAGLQIYFRFSVDRRLEPETSSFDKKLVGHTAAYLELADVDAALNRCVISSLDVSSITIEHLHHTRSSHSYSSHGLPPLSPFFVPRKEPMEKITDALRARVPGSPAIALVIGLSGTGKTQISLKYAYDHNKEYDHIIFIDASSAESIEKGLITRLQSIDRQFRPTSIKAALNLLSYPEGHLSPKWLIILDNADNCEVDLRNYIPACDHGRVLITTRNATLSNLHPGGYIPLDVMSSEEATEALLSTALGPEISPISHFNPTMAPPRSVPRTKRDRECAAAIVEELGYLPLAVIQAACYIRMHKCLHDYSNHLKVSRSILDWTPSVQRDRLQYGHSIYAAFDTTLNALSPRARQFLGIMSFVHFSDFPRVLIAIAASSFFGYQPFDLLDRTSEYTDSLKLLRQVFCPKGTWDQLEFDALLEELQTYSLVTLIPVFAVIMLRFHPLLHGWANDRLAPSNRTLYRAAAVRLLVCGTNSDDDYLWPYLAGHIDLLPLSSKELHVNDKAALAQVLRANRQMTKSFKIWEDIYAIVRIIYGETHIRTTRAALQLASVHSDLGNWAQMELMEREIIAIRIQDLGITSLDTADAMANLARTCKWLGKRYDEAERLETSVLRIRKQLLGPMHRTIVQAMSDLAATCMLKRNYMDADALLLEALDMITALVGEDHVATLRIMSQRAHCFTRSGRRDEASRMTQDLTERWRAIRGEMPTSTPDSLAKLAVSYFEQGQHQEAESTLRDLVESKGKPAAIGCQHDDALDAIHWLASFSFVSERYAEAEMLSKQLVASGWDVIGEGCNKASSALFLLALSVSNQQRHAEAVALWREVVSVWKEARGDQDKDTLEAIGWLAHETAELLKEEKKEANINALGKRYILAKPRSYRNHARGPPISFITKVPMRPVAKGLYRLHTDNVPVFQKMTIFLGIMKHRIVTVYEFIVSPISLMCSSCM